MKSPTLLTCGYRWEGVMGFLKVSYISVFVPVCLSVYLPTCFFVCVSVCLPGYLFVSVSVCLPLFIRLSLSSVCLREAIVNVSDTLLICLSLCMFRSAWMEFLCLHSFYFSRLYCMNASPLYGLRRRESITSAFVCFFVCLLVWLFVWFRVSGSLQGVVIILWLPVSLCHSLIRLLFGFCLGVCLHASPSVSVLLSVSVFVFVPLPVSIYLCPSVYPGLSLFVYVRLSASFFVSICLYMSIYVSVRLPMSICVSLCPCMSNWVSVYLSIYVIVSAIVLLSLSPFVFVCIMYVSYLNPFLSISSFLWPLLCPSTSLFFFLIASLSFLSLCFFVCIGLFPNISISPSALMYPSNHQFCCLWFCPSFKVQICPYHHLLSPFLSLFVLVGFVESSSCCMHIFIPPTACPRLSVRASLFVCVLIRTSVSVRVRMSTCPALCPPGDVSRRLSKKGRFNRPSWRSALPPALNHSAKLSLSLFRQRNRPAFTRPRARQTRPDLTKPNFKKPGQVWPDQTRLDKTRPDRTNQILKTQDQV